MSPSIPGNGSAFGGHNSFRPVFDGRNSCKDGISLQRSSSCTKQSAKLFDRSWALKLFDDPLLHSVPDMKIKRVQIR